MTSETLFEMIGTIKENYISEAVSPAAPARHYAKIAGLLAACAAALFITVIALHDAGLLRLGSRNPHSGNIQSPGNTATPPGNSETSADNASPLPILPLEEDIITGCGFEGYLAYSPDELVGTTPWNDAMTLESLPVYRNHHVSDGAGMAFADAEKLKTQVRDFASRMGIRDLAIDVNTMPDQGAYEAVGTAPGITIRADAAQEIRIDFQPALRLPANLNFTYNDSSYDDMKAAGSYLAGAYADLLQMQNPTVDVIGGDYSFSGEQEYGLRIYDDSGDITQRLISHDFQGSSFYCDGDGRLWIIRVSQYDLSEKVGDYPLITPAKAKDLLCQGHYLTTVPVRKIPAKEHVVKTELLYRLDRNAQYFMPYYRFLVELSDEELGFDPDGHAAGLKTYGAYYVPAIQAEYLSHMPIWNERFN